MLFGDISGRQSTGGISEIGWSEGGDDVAFSKLRFIDGGEALNNVTSIRFN